MEVKQGGRSRGKGLRVATGHVRKKTESTGQDEGARGKRGNRLRGRRGATDCCVNKMFVDRIIVSTTPGEGEA